MLSLQIRVDTSAARALFGDKLPKALPYVKAAMLTKLAAGGRDAIVRQMPVDFMGPTKFTLGGVWMKKADKSTPAQVYVPDSADDNGAARREYLIPGVQGSAKRRQKRTEYLLTRNGFLPAGWVTTPGKAAKLNADGNIPAPVYKQIVNVLQIKRVESARARAISGASQKRAAKMGVQREWFAVQPGKNTLGRKGSWLPPGVYRRTGRNGETLEQILKFVRKAAYRPRLDFDGTVREFVVKNVQAAWDESAASVFAKFSAKK